MARPNNDCNNTSPSPPTSSSSSSSRTSSGQFKEVQESSLKCFFNALTRKKPLDCRTDTSLNRCLNLVDLTALGVGSTLGLGLYVLAGQVASNKAGPGVVISFALAALASAFSALCYAEFAGRVPRAGSAYAYSYITVGEFVAFVIGWNLILEYVIGASSVARGFSGYLCYVFRHLAQQLGLLKLSSESTTIYLPPISHHNLTTTAMAMAPKLLTNTTGGGGGGGTSLDAAIANYVWEYFDWPSIVIILVITMFVLFGVKESTNVNMIFTCLNLLVVFVVVLSSIQYLEIHNWQLTKEEIPAGFGEGGFLPYGWSGVLAGSATCFFGFIGFDTIASSAEEAKNPKRNVPVSIILSLFISFLAYMSIAIVQTLLWPYYDQNKVTILPYIFEKLELPIVYWIVLLGAIAGLASSQLGGMYPLPRILYSMAHDKLIYSYLAKVNARLKLPVRATIVGSVFIAILSCLLDIQDLADMVSIGTLAAYSLVSLSVLILRYENRTDAVDDSTIISNHLTLTDILHCTIQPTEEKFMMSTSEQKSLNNGLINNDWFVANNNKNQLEYNSKEATKESSGIFSLLICKSNQLKPTNETSKQSKTLIAAIVFLTILLDLIALFINQDKYHNFHLASDNNSTTIYVCVTSILILVVALLIMAMLMLSRLPSGNCSEDMFQVPCVPLVPMLSILVNTFLMFNLSYLTWVRFSVWMAFGLFIYFTYGIWNSEGYLLYLNR